MMWRPMGCLGRLLRRPVCALVVMSALAACTPGGDLMGVAGSGDPSSGDVQTQSQQQGQSPARSGAAAGVLGPPVPRADSLARSDAAAYRIASNDILDVAVYQVPDLNRSVQVDERGNISLPLISIVKAAGRTSRELEGDIAQRLGDRYLRSPQVTVFVKEAVGQRVTVDGAVKSPGVVQAKGAMTLLTVIALAQGFSDIADPSGVMIFRETQQGRTAARFDATEIRAGRTADPPIYGGDTIVVDESSAKTAWKQFREALPVAGMFRLL